MCYRVHSSVESSHGFLKINLPKPFIRLSIGSSCAIAPEDERGRDLGLYSVVVKASLKVFACALSGAIRTDSCELMPIGLELILGHCYILLYDVRELCSPLIK